VLMLQGAGATHTHIHTHTLTHTHTHIHTHTHNYTQGAGVDVLTTKKAAAAKVVESHLPYFIRYTFHVFTS
jgi:hypothetical protein